jgi:hypothetical protein
VTIKGTNGDTREYGELRSDVLKMREAKVGMMADTAKRALQVWATFQFADLAIGEFVEPKNDGSVFQVIIEGTDSTHDASIAFWEGSGNRLQVVYFMVSATELPEWASDQPVFVRATVNRSEQYVRLRFDSLVAYGWPHAPEDVVKATFKAALATN